MSDQSNNFGESFYYQFRWIHIKYDLIYGPIKKCNSRLTGICILGLCSGGEKCSGTVQTKIMPMRRVLLHIYKIISVDEVILVLCENRVYVLCVPIAHS